MGWIKLCGVSSSDELAIAKQAGADAVGLLHLKRQHDDEKGGSDRLSVSKLALISDAAARLHIQSVLLVHTLDFEFLSLLCREVSPRVLQIQATVEWAALDRIKSSFPAVTIMKTVKNRGAEAELMREVEAAAFHEVVDQILVDAARPGSGVRHDLDVCRKISSVSLGKPWVLAGGLTAENVAEAICKVLPDGVDVMSGVRGVDRKVDNARAIQFVSNARLAFNEVSR